MLNKTTNFFVCVLGTAQDAGYPQVGCNSECCQVAWNGEIPYRFPSCIAIINKKLKKYWLIDITPEIKNQINILKPFDYELAGVFITHAHSGHYMGLLNLGLEIMNVKEIPIYVMPRMLQFLKSNQITNQLIENENIILIQLEENKAISIFNEISVIPFDVPHRNEFSETAGFKIISKNKSIIYLPDIDSWNNWEESIFRLIMENDFLFIDGTFYDKNEIRHRDISKIPHPSIKDTMKLLINLDIKLKSRIYFTHLNHTNKAINTNSKYFKKVSENNFNILMEKDVFYL